MIRSYWRLRQLRTFEERYEYLKLSGAVGQSTFGFDRYINQALYSSTEWTRTRRDVILRDDCCDLGILDRLIPARPVIHHINPITLDDIEAHSDKIFDLDNLICCSLDTHNAIHYGDASLLVSMPPERKKGDTLLWTPYSQV